jgi:hypothetical protein
MDFEGAIAPPDNQGIQLPTDKMCGTPSSLPEDHLALSRTLSARIHSAHADGRGMAVNTPANPRRLWEAVCSCGGNG